MKVPDGNIPASPNAAGDLARGAILMSIVRLA
jgi:hypothetical protein